MDKLNNLTLMANATKKIFEEDMVKMGNIYIVFSLIVIGVIMNYVYKENKKELEKLDKLIFFLVKIVLIRVVFN